MSEGLRLIMLLVSTVSERRRENETEAEKVSLELLLMTRFSEISRNEIRSFFQTRKNIKDRE
jgi:hypothetical protein